MIIEPANRVDPASSGRHEARLEALARALPADGLDAYLATSDESIAYLSGFRPLQLERLFAVVVRPEVDSILVPALDEGQLQNAPPCLQRKTYGADSDGSPELLRELKGTLRIGVEEDHLTLSRARALEAGGVELISAGAILMGLRARKDAEEVERVRRTCTAIETALRRLFHELRVGETEQAVNAKVDGWLRAQGATDAHSLVLFGSNAANPHAQPGPRPLQVGDVVCADVSACIEGYWGDLTRCATVGPPSLWAQRAWAVVRQAQVAAIAACRFGNSAREVDLSQRRIVEASSDLGRCLHGAGHAIGLAIHEPPFLVPRTETLLEAGMILTIEPGIYHPDHGGIRLEDDVLVTSGEPELLSGLPHELFEIPLNASALDA